MTGRGLDLGVSNSTRLLTMGILGRHIGDPKYKPAPGYLANFHKMGLFIAYHPLPLNPSLRASKLDSQTWYLALLLLFVATASSTRKNILASASCLRKIEATS
ncbi:hypothetical protein K449DRAFT_388947 [Hypoxylon sp. EC38]|nr:hypothetical protein K449DRAFT_388947 [Hypoxylon sp. EC38]